MGGQWFNSFDYSKKNEDVKNYVEITPEQQAAIDEANKKAAAEELAHVLSKKQPDLDKGVKIQSGTPSMEEQVLAHQGEIRQADPWYTRMYNNTAHHVSTFVKEAVESVIGGAAIVLNGAALLFPVSCAKADDDIPDPSVKVTVTNKEMAQYVVDYLNNPNNEQGFKADTADNIGFTYGYDYNATNDAAKPYIKIGDNIKLYINQDPLTVPTTTNVIDYITTIGDELKTYNGEGYNFNDKQGKPEVAFDNGITHIVGDKVDVTENSPMGTMYSMLGKAGFEQPALNQVLLDFQPNEQGSFGNKAQGFSLSLVTPADLKTITTGNPQVKGSIGGVEFSGTLAKDSDGNITVTNGDKKVTISQVRGGINLGTEDEPDIYNDGVVVSFGEGNEFFMRKHDNNGGIDIGKIHGANDGQTNLQYYQNISGTFDTQGATDADKYYNDKQTNLRTVQTTADSNYRYINQWKFDANANANVNH